MTSDVGDTAPQSFAFGPFVLVPQQQMLLAAGTPVRVGGRALDILTVLVNRAGQLLSKRELLDQVWPNTVVEEGNLKVNMAHLRRALGDEADAAQYIATVNGRGYRFIAPVRTSGSPDLMLAPITTRGRAHNLPIGPTRVIGRSETVAAVRGDLDRQRLVSIVGAGGVGKTTVARAVAQQAHGSFEDGTWWVDLDTSEEPDLIPDALAAAVGLPSKRPTTIGSLCDDLRDREMLLVLDGCESLIDAVAACVDRLLATCAGVKVLATSREPLSVRGERVRKLAGLVVPPSADVLNTEDALGFSAVQLFVERATEKLESFALRGSDAPVVVEICRRLGGLPLAIEIAATRIDVFGVDGLARWLEDDPLRLLVGVRAGPERHRSLSANLDWSYRLLSGIEAAVLRAASVFTGPFDSTGASAATNLTEVEAADVLARLAAKSLVEANFDADDVVWRFPETTRVACLERLRISGDDRTVRRRHAEHVCTVLERAANGPPHGSPRTWVACGHVLEDLCDALAWAASDGADPSLRIRLTIARNRLMSRSSPTAVYRSTLEQPHLQALDQASPPRRAAVTQLRQRRTG